jgi:hypothetical protein
VTIVVDSTRARNPRYSGGTSDVLVPHDAFGRHVCTTHRITDPEGNVLHWDEEDVKLETETVAKE